ncbi:PF20097 family protein [Luteolibacter sp. Populi]|uniref:PF20097 family protein n=1 Tax=Luteolibacter sp. Populi TaxID=3230487 RepID=UPI0034658BC7
MSPDNPYEVPASNPSPEAKRCPDCGGEMQEGNATGQLFWKNDDAPRRFLFWQVRKPLFVGKAFRIVVSTPRAEGHYCPACGLAILKIPK